MRWLFVALLLLSQTAYAISGIDLHLFLNGDNDLLGIDDEGQPIHQAQLVFSDWLKAIRGFSPEVDTHIYFDPNGDIEGARLRSTLLQSYRGSELTSSQSFAETDSTDPMWLKRLLDKGASGDRLRVLIFWGHGAGWEPVEDFDYSEAGKSWDYFATGELLRLGEVDLVIFDACRMATLEVLSAFEGLVPFLVASQFELPLEGIQYGDAWQSLTDFTVNYGHLDKQGAALAFFNALARSTTARQKETRTFAPLLFLKTDKFAGLNQAFTQLIEKLSLYFADLPRATKETLWSEIAQKSLLRSPAVAAPRSAYLFDLKALVHQLDSRAIADGAGVLESFSFVSHEGFGSLGLFLPSQWGEWLMGDEDLSPTYAAAMERTSTNWAKKLANWNWRKLSW